MKVTALIPDEVVREVTRHSKGNNLTECLVIALKDWISSKKIAQLNQEVLKHPLRFCRSFSALKARNLNRRPS